MRASLEFVQTLVHSAAMGVGTVCRAPHVTLE